MQKTQTATLNVAPRSASFEHWQLVYRYWLLYDNRSPWPDYLKSDRYAYLDALPNWRLRLLHMTAWFLKPFRA